MPLEAKILTPENIAIHYQLAGPVSRAVAWLNDLFYQGILILVGTLVINIFLSGYSVRSLNEAFSIGFGLFIFWGYHTYFEVFAEGRSPGKKYVGIRVVRLDGQAIDFFPSLIRNILRLIDFLPIGFLLGLVTMLMNNRHQRLGDLLARTMVIREPSRPPDKDPIVSFLSSSESSDENPSARRSSSSSPRPTVQKPGKPGTPKSGNARSGEKKKGSSLNESKKKEKLLPKPADDDSKAGDTSRDPGEEKP
ncbi:MAG: RDD family protein [Candidatus Ozemobacteraceae bacterium]